MKSGFMGYGGYVVLVELTAQCPKISDSSPSLMLQFRNIRPVSGDGNCESEAPARSGHPTF